VAKKALSSLTDQVTELLYQGMLEGRWRGTLPGRDQLAVDFGCSHWTVEQAMQRLSRQGLLISEGTGRRRRILLLEGAARPRTLRVMILLYEESDRKASYLVDLLHRLRDTGHDAIFADKTMRDLGMNVERVARYAQKMEVDAWVVMAGSRDVLDWFAGQNIPTFALFGRNTHSTLASISLQKPAALIELANLLVELGHQRIVILAREERRRPTPAFLEQLFLDRLEELGIPTGPFNLPDWGNSPREFHKNLDALFRTTPPTALIVDQPSLCLAVLQHLSKLGISSPEDVSLACTDQSEFFEWCDPGITHFSWDIRPVINRVVKWADNISRGKEDHRKSAQKVKLVLGGTIGAVTAG
jgi:DNA-binding LacI/PurR family transcriptional regulator